MRADRTLPAALRASATIAALLCGFAAAARAEGVYGTVQVQYQKADIFQTLLVGDSLTYTQKNSSELWVKSVDMHHQDYLRPDLMLESNFRFSDQSRPDNGTLQRTPYGSMRLLHPWFQVLLSHQPSMQRASLSAQSGLNPDSLTRRNVTTHNTESMLNGHIGVPRWPQLDLAWTRRRRDGAGASGERNDARSVRATFDRERYSAYGGVTDQRVSAGTPGTHPSSQQVWNGGASVRVTPMRAASLTAQYDMTDVTGRTFQGPRPQTISHSATVTGDWRPAPRWSTNLNYAFRHVDFGIVGNPPQNDHEGSLLERWNWSKAASLLGGGGLHTVRLTNAGGGTTPRLQEYLTAVALLDARVRPHWTVAGSLSHTTNFDPDRSPYGVQTLGGTTRAQLSRRLQFDATMQLSQNGDTASASQRFSNSWAARLQGQALRNLMLAGSLRSTRIGTGLFRATSVTRGIAGDLNWRPVPTLQLVGSYARNTILPASTGRNSSRSLSARFEPTSHWQWYGSWTRTDQRVFASAAGQLSSREVVSTRLQYAPSRRLAASVGTTISEPGRSDESRQLDAALTWSFGR